MLRALVLSTIFPSEARPYEGNFIAEALTELAKRRAVQLTVAVPRSGQSARSRRHWHGLDVAELALSETPAAPEERPAQLAQAILPLARELRDQGLNVLAAEVLWPDGPAIAEVARTLGLPFTIKARGHEFEMCEGRPALIAQARAAAGEAAKVLAVSARLRDRLLDAGFCGAPIAVHYTGVDHGRFKPADRAMLKRQLKVSGPLLLSVGNLIAAKGHAFAIEALARLPAATLFIAGGGQDAAALQARIEALGLDARARLLGHVPHLMLPSLMAAADVTILASTREGLANVWVESLACGTPVVTTDVDGAREALDRPAAGRIVERDPEAIAAAVRELLASPPPASAVAAAAARFSWPGSADALDQHLREAAGIPAPA